MKQPVCTASPCGSGRPLTDCCGRYHADEWPPTPEALMRSHYSAFVLDLPDYLLATWHPSTRPSSLGPDAATVWTCLEVLESGEEGERGWVHFRATFREGKRWSVLEESSRFVHEAGRWFYLDGNPAVHRLKPGQFYPDPLERALIGIDLRLGRWARKKYKRLRGHKRRSWAWVKKVRKAQPTLFAHWEFVYSKKVG